jgi:flagellum-specific ATP synthase
MADITTQDHQDIALRCRQIMADYRDAEDLINIGAYVKGSSPKIDFALDRIDKLNAFLRQRVEDRADFGQSLDYLKEMLNNGNGHEKI